MLKRYTHDTKTDEELLELSSEGLHILWQEELLSGPRLTEIELRKAALVNPMASDLCDDEILRARKKAQKSLPANPNQAGDFTEECIRELEANGTLRPSYRKDGK